MFRFFATLLVTGVGVLGASAWWSGRDTPSVPASLAEQPTFEVPASEPAAEAAAEADVSVPEKPAVVARPAPVVAAEPKVAPRTVPPIPAPRLVDPTEFSHIVAPVLPEPIPTPFVPPGAPEEVEETRIPEPAVFSDETLELAREESFGAELEEFAGETYGEENVIYVEGDEDVADLFASEDEAPFMASDGERELAMSDQDASAARIRRLLDVYESLGSGR
ncbi:MAG: hypothetical protein JRH10_12120 [Deltaproteobacteria bacterium]|nr:hypothetical protein [Deltaproteobacteria bacterium]MBW2448717.1 hypothetical protein [Deltaproteobacteria bacterium]